MKTRIAVLLYKMGKHPKCSTFIDEDTITLGYGRLDSIGTWEYDLPPKYVERIMGTKSWSEYMVLKEDIFDYL